MRLLTVAQPFKTTTPIYINDQLLMACVHLLNNVNQ